MVHIAIIIVCLFSHCRRILPGEVHSLADLSVNPVGFKTIRYDWYYHKLNV